MHYGWCIGPPIVPVRGIPDHLKLAVDNSDLSGALNRVHVHWTATTSV
jgi:hypothetical protein